MACYKYLCPFSKFKKCFPFHNVNFARRELGEVKGELAVAHHSGASGLGAGMAHAGGGGAGAGGGGGGASHGGANAEEMRQLREELAETRASEKSNDKE